jgi:hypothetical protein
MPRTLSPFGGVYGIGGSSARGRITTLMSYLRLRHWIIGAGILVFLFSPKISFGSENQAVIYEFPPHFKGWVLIQYEDPACAALPSGTGSIHVPIPESGCACTSDALPLGFRSIRFERVHPDSTREVIPSRVHDDSSEIWIVAQGRGLTGWGRSPSYSFAKHFSWGARRSMRPSANWILSALSFPSRRFVRN